MSEFESNSVPLMKAGYRFGTIITKEPVANLPAGAIVPLWVSDEKSNPTHLHAILGSEPKLGINQPIELERAKLSKLTLLSP